MTDNDLFELVAGVLNVPIEKITLQSGPNDFQEWDSIAHVTLCAAVEQVHNIQLTMPEMLAIRCVEDLMQTLKKQGVSVSKSKC
jgi:acyl carrier protein